MIKQISKELLENLSLKQARVKTEEFQQLKYDMERGALYMALKQIHRNGHLHINKNGTYYFQSTNNHGFDYFLRNKTIGDKLQEISGNLKKVKIYNKDYKKIIEKSKKEDFIYMDPPYFLENRKGSIYNNKGEEIMLQELREQIDILTNKGVYVMLSNSNYPMVKEIFKGYNIKIIKVYRPFKKEYESELIIRNYK